MGFYRVFHRVLWGFIGFFIGFYGVLQGFGWFWFIFPFTNRVF